MRIPRTRFRGWAFPSSSCLMGRRACAIMDRLARSRAAELAATWDVSLAQAYGQAMGLESRARGVHFILGPGMNICRVPVNGRNFEYFGEDPFLAGQIAANWVQGVQSEGVIAAAKHFAANNQEWHRDNIDEQIDERTLHEIYLPAFRAAVTQGGAGAVMAAYNQVNGDYCAASDMLLNQILRKEWGFTGLVMSDWGACHSTSALANGLDLEMGTAVFFKEDNIKRAVADGENQGIGHRHRGAAHPSHGDRDGISRPHAKANGHSVGFSRFRSHGAEYRPIGRRAAQERKPDVAAGADFGSSHCRLWVQMPMTPPPAAAGAEP